MQRCRTALWAGSARSMLVRIILLICTGWILNLAGGGVEGAPLIEHGSGDDGGKSNNRIDGQHSGGGGDVHSLNIRTDHNHLNTYPDRDNNKTKTDSVGGSSPVILLPDNVLRGLKQYENDNKNGTLEELEEAVIVTSHEEDADESNSKKPAIIVMEYQPELVIRCAATGVPKPNVSWELEDGSFSHYVVSNSLTHGYGYYGHGHSNDSEVEVWVDLKLPKLNNAFYGKIRCRAENAFGNTTWEMELTHNANSSTFMKMVRCVLAGVFLLVSILVVRGFMWVDQKRQDKLYEKLPPQDFEIIKKFKTGLTPPPPSPCASAIITHDIHIGNHSLLLSSGGGGVSSCMPMPSVEITVEENGTESREGYKPVIRGSSSPDFQHRMTNRSGGASTPSTCSARSQILNAVNSWTNYEPYDDKLETSSQHFNIDFSKIIENGSFGIMYAGKMRNDLTMEWSTVAVKTGKTERDENYILESMLTELKILASLPKSHEYIRNLKGAYTKLLHKRQAFVFLDFCENGTLANFIDLNRKFFWNIFKNSNNDDGTDRLNEQAASSANRRQAHHSNEAITFTAKTDGVVINKPGKDDKIPIEYPITFKDLLAWSSQIADGMNFLHKNRVIHGNLSTANIYVTSTFKIKIGNIGYTPVMDDILATEEGASKWLSVPHYEPFSKISDLWEYGRVLWEIFSLREQQCPDNGRIANFIQSGREEDDDDEDDDGLEIPQFATHEIFELMLCCWNDNATLCPEFDVFVKSFKKMYKEVVQLTGGKSEKPQTG